MKQIEIVVHHPSRILRGSVFGSLNKIETLLAAAHDDARNPSRGKVLNQGELKHIANTIVRSRIVAETLGLVLAEAPESNYRTDLAKRLKDLEQGISDVLALTQNQGDTSKLVLELKSLATRTREITALCQGARGHDHVPVKLFAPLESRYQEEVLGRMRKALGDTQISLRTEEECLRPVADLTGVAVFDVTDPDVLVAFAAGSWFAYVDPAYMLFIHDANRQPVYHAPEVATLGYTLEEDDKTWQVIAKQIQRAQKSLQQ